MTPRPACGSTRRDDARAPVGRVVPRRTEGVVDERRDRGRQSEDEITGDDRLREGPGQRRGERLARGKTTVDHGVAVEDRRHVRRRIGLQRGARVDRERAGGEQSAVVRRRRAADHFDLDRPRSEGDITLEFEVGARQRITRPSSV